MDDEVIDWQNWIERHGRVALLYAAQIAGSRADAEDAVSDGFVRFWRRRATARNLPAMFFACVPGREGAGNDQGGHDGQGQAGAHEQQVQQQAQQ